MRQPPRPSTSRLIALAIVVGAALLVASTWQYFGQTWDEPEHLAAGLELVQHGRYEYDIQHPPLARALIALGPFLAGARTVGLKPPNGEPEGREILYGEGHYRLFLALARLGTLPFLVLLLAGTWWWTRISGDGETAEPTALLALALVASTPPVLGHAGLAALDIAAAATAVLAFCALLNWLERPRRASALLFGVASGIAVATKLSALPFIGIALPTLALLRLAVPGMGAPPRERAPPRRAATWTFELFLIAGVVAVILTLAYGARFAYLTDPRYGYAHAIDWVFGTHGPARDTVRSIAAHVPVPVALPLVLGGIEALEVHNSAGHMSYLFGELRSTGWWYFYFVALGAKLPLPLLILGVPGLAGMVIAGIRRRSWTLLATPALFAVILAFVSLFSHINLGVRHVLVLVPLLATAAAWAAAQVWSSARTATAARRMAAGVGLVALLLWQASTLARAYPDYLAYFNEAVAHPERVLVDSDLDWGQDLWRLEERARALGIAQLTLAFLSSADLHREPLPPFTLLRPGERASGWIAINQLARIHGGNGYDWLAGYAVRERVGKTIDLYYVAPAPGSAQPTRSR